MTPSIESIPYGYCGCGCGNKTTIAKSTCASRGHKKGVPQRFMIGHGHKYQASLRKPEEAVPFKIDGVSCRILSLTQGQITILWEVDYYKFAYWKWFAHWEENTNRFYACRSATDKNGKKITIWLLREILGLMEGDGLIGDHIDISETLDNRRSNLRIVTPSQSMMNTGLRKCNLARAKGCSWNNGSYLVRIVVNGKTICLGRRRNLEDAKALFAWGVQKYHGEYGRVA